MSACEKCWAEASGIAANTGRATTDVYLEVLARRENEHSPALPAVSPKYKCEHGETKGHYFTQQYASGPVQLLCDGPACEQCETPLDLGCVHHPLAQPVEARESQEFAAWIAERSCGIEFSSTQRMLMNEAWDAGRLRAREAPSDVPVESTDRFTMAEIDSLMPATCTSNSSDEDHERAEVAERVVSRLRAMRAADAAVCPAMGGPAALRAMKPNR